MYKFIPVLSLALIATQSFASGLMLVPNNTRGEQMCKQFLAEELHITKPITLKEQEGVDDNGNKILAAGIFLVDGKAIGAMYPNDTNPDMADCEVIR